MFEQTFHSILALARSESGLSLRKLEKLCGLKIHRLSRLELGEERPYPAERRILAGVLSPRASQLLYSVSRPQRYYQRLRNRGARYLPLQEPYYPPRDRSSKVRIAAAYRNYPAEMAQLASLVRRHPDFCVVNAFCEDAPLDSGLECLFITSLFARGAEPLVIAPYTLSPRLAQSVICPKKKVDVGFRPRPGIELDRTLYLPQVAFKTPATFVVDFLRYQDGTWSAIEIDGRGHDSGRDHIKENALTIPVVRFQEEQVLEIVRLTLRQRKAA